MGVRQRFGPLSVPSLSGTGSRRLQGGTIADTRQERSDQTPPPEDCAAIAEEAFLVERALSGDLAAFDAVVMRYASRIFTHLYRLVKNREEAEDLAQEAFLRAFRFLHTYDSKRPLRSWLYTIATNVGLNALRARRRRIPSNVGEDYQHVDEPREDGRDAAMRGELAERMEMAISRLPAQSAALVQLYYRDGMSLAEAARVLGTSETAAKVTLFRARQRLRQWLLEEDGDE